MVRHVHPGNQFRIPEIFHMVRNCRVVTPAHGDVYQLLQVRPSGKLRHR